MVMRQKYREILYGYIVFLFIDPVVLVSPSKNEEKDCEQVSIDDCLTKVQPFLNLTSVPFTPDKTQIDQLCSNAKEGYSCSSKLLSTSGCVMGRKRELLDNFITLAQHNMFWEEFCLTWVKTRTKRRYDDYDSGNECIIKQIEGLECCVEKSKVGELSIPQLIMKIPFSGGTDAVKSACCTVAKYVQCVGSVMLKSCGDASSNSVTDQIGRVIGGEVEQVCRATVGILQPGSAECTEPAPVCASSRIGTFAEFIVLISLLFIMWINYVSSFN